MTWLTLSLFTACAGLSSVDASYTGTIEITEVEVSSAIPGRLVSIGPQEGDRVVKGAPVFELDAEAVAAERQVRAAAVEMAEAAIDGAKAQVRTARAQVTYLERETARLTRMQEKGVGSAQQRSTLQGQLDVARAQVSAANQAVIQATAGRAQAQAALAAVDQQMSNTRVAAPIDGVVLSRNREPGEVVAPGMSVVTLGDLDRPRLRIYVPLQTVQTLSIGDEVQVTVDARPDDPIVGKVERVASEAEFTPRDILTPEERVKRVFAVDVALEPGPGLLPGVPADARLP